MLQGKIYKITYIDDPTQFYLGSTCDIPNRFHNHKSAAPRLRSKLHRLMIEKGFDKFIIELVLDYPCETKQELLEKEDELITLLKPTLNDYKAIGLNIERNKSAVIASNERRKLKLINCDCGKVIRA